MKFSVREERTAKQIRMEQVTKYNKKELDEFMAGVCINEVPENMYEFIMNLEYRITSIRLMSYNAFQSKFPSRTLPGSFFGVLDGKDSKTGFPTLYIYSPELESIAVKQESDKKKAGNLKRISSFILGRNKLSMEKEPSFVKFVTEVLPADVPFNLITDGSRRRVENLSHKEGAKLYGSCDDEIFAVEHVLADVPTLTIYLSQIDFVSEFATKLEKKLEIGDKLATQLSSNLPHDTYYSIQGNVETNFETFVTKMAYLLKVNPGDIVHDYLQGDVEVVTGAHSKKVALDLDDEYPAAILVGNRINLFVPNWGQVEET